MTIAMPQSGHHRSRGFVNVRAQRMLLIGAVLWLVLVVAACGGSENLARSNPDDSTGTTPGSVQPEPSTSRGPDNGEPANGEPADSESAAGQDPTSTLTGIDWWGCWQAADARNASGGIAGDGEQVESLPNCAAGPSSVGQVGDMSHPSSPPTFRAAGADGHPSIEFTFKGDTLLQTNGGQPWSGDAVLPAAGQGVTMAWIGMTMDIDSHRFKFLVSGLSDRHEYPMLRAEGEGARRFAGYGGGATDAVSSEGTITDFALHGVIVHLGPDGSTASVEVDGADIRSDQRSDIRADVSGLTLGNSYRRNFSTTDHQFVFLGLREGEMSPADKDAFWAYLDSL